MEGGALLVRRGVFRSMAEALRQVEDCASLAGDNQEVQALLDAAGDNLRRAMRDLRQELSPLGGLPLGGLDLRQGLEQLVAYARRAEGAPVDAFIDEAIAPVLPECQVGHILQIAKEALANAILHAGASAIALRAEVEAGQLVLRLSDDGQGFDVKQALTRPESGGLVSMQRRAEAVRGVLSVVSDPQAGTILTLTVPWPSQRPAPLPGHHLAPHRVG